jgi:tetratricopeptide (TPR) repeat protein
VADRDFEARIRELKKRVEHEPGSRFFVPLAEEYRKAGRLTDTIATLEAGLGVHAGYVAARIALARAYLEAGRTDESMAAFSKALSEDPSNLVAAKALGDLYLSRGESLEALKRYLRFRAISGDRRLDAVIAKLEAEAPAPPREPAADSAPPPPPAFPPTPTEPAASLAPPLARMESLRASAQAGGLPQPRPMDPFEISGITYERPSGPVPIASEALDVPSRDLSLDALGSTRDGEIITRKIRLPEATWPFETPPAPAPVEPAPPPLPEEPCDSAPAGGLPAPASASPKDSAGRTLADLYFEQGHYSEAVGQYQELLSADPSNEELRRLRDDAARRSAAPPPPPLPAGDPGRERRLAKIRILNEWLAVIRTNAGNRESRIGDR